MSKGNSVDELRHIIRTCPVIDNHGHNLLRPHGLRSSDFLTITSEATGKALRDTPTTLAHLRAAKQLRKLYELPVEADWNAILDARNRLLYEDPDSLTRKCLEGTQTILIDDGLGADDFEPYQWHSQYILSPCKRIVRIEAVAASILASLHQQWKLPVGISIADEEACSLAWVKFITAFEQAIARAIEDEEVVGFKSVICYRSGLSVKVGRDIEVTEAGLKSFMDEFLPTCESRSFRVESIPFLFRGVVVVVCCVHGTGVGYLQSFRLNFAGDAYVVAASVCRQAFIGSFAPVPICHRYLCIWCMQGSVGEEVRIGDFTGHFDREQPSNIKAFALIFTHCRNIIRKDLEYGAKVLIVPAST